MATALTAYLTSTTDTLLTTSKQIAATAPSSETSFASLANQKLTGWFFLQPINTNSTSSGSEPAPNGQGWIFDSTVLEGQSIVAGTWTPTIKVGASASWTGTIHMRAYKRSSGGVYTLIADFTTGSITVGTAAVYSLTTQTVSSVSFTTGDKLYVDVVVDITTAATTTTASTTVYFNGGANESLVTPGYTPTLFSLAGSRNLLGVGA